MKWPQWISGCSPFLNWRRLKRPPKIDRGPKNPPNPFSVVFGGPMTVRILESTLRKRNYSTSLLVKHPPRIFSDYLDSLAYTHPPHNRRSYQNKYVYNPPEESRYASSSSYSTSLGSLLHSKTLSSLLFFVILISHSCIFASHTPRLFCILH